MPIFRKARNIGKYQVVLETGIEPVRLYGTRDFKKAHPMITLHYLKLYKAL